MTLEELGRFEAATEAFDLMLAMPAVRADPRFTARLRARRSAALAELGRLEEARADAEWIITGQDPFTLRGIPDPVTACVIQRATAARAEG